MDKNLKKMATIVAEKAYGASGKKMLERWFKKKKEKKRKKEEQKEPVQSEVTNLDQVQDAGMTNSGAEMAKEVQEAVGTNSGAEMTPEVQDADVTNSEQVKAPEVQEAVGTNSEQIKDADMTNSGAENTSEVQEAVGTNSGAENTPGEQEQAEDVTKEGRAELKTREKDAKGKYPSLFSLFSEIMGGDENSDKSDDVLNNMLMAAFASWMGVDVFKERLDEIERQMQEAAEHDRQEKAKDKEKDKEQEVPTVAQPVKEKTIEEPVSEPTQTQNETPEKRLSPAEDAYAKMAGDKEQVTLADLEKAGVNLKTDLQPVLKELLKDNPDKLSELAPKGLGNKNVTVSKEFAVALIERKQQRDAIMRNNMNMRS